MRPRDPTIPLVRPGDDGGVVWVKGHLKRELEEAECELVRIACAAFRTGPWNLGSWRSLTQCGGGHGATWVIPIAHDELATFDGGAMSRLVFAAHDRCCRVSVQVAGRCLRMLVFRRDRDGRSSRRHPRLKEAVADYRSSTTCPASLEVEADGWAGINARAEERIRKVEAELANCAGPIFELRRILGFTQEDGGASHVGLSEVLGRAVARLRLEEDRPVWDPALDPGAATWGDCQSPPVEKWETNG